MGEWSYVLFYLRKWTRCKPYLLRVHGGGIFSKNKNWSYATNVEKLSAVEGYILLAQ